MHGETVKISTKLYHQTLQNLNTKINT